MKKSSKAWGEIKDIHKPIVYECVDGYKLLVAPIWLKGQSLYYILAGILVDSHNKDLIASRLSKRVPIHEWEAWKCALNNTPAYDRDGMETVLSQLEGLAEVIEVLLEREEENYASRLQLLNLFSLMDRHDLNWLQSVLDVFVRVTGLEFAGFARKTKGEQYTVKKRSVLKETRLCRVRLFLRVKAS